MYDCMVCLFMKKVVFEWDDKKDKSNQKKHNISFDKAKLVFFDQKRVVAKDLSHSQKEQRYYCFGKIEEGILTVRFTYRKNIIRIFGAGYWRKGKVAYEKQNKIY